MTTVHVYTSQNSRNNNMESKLVWLMVCFWFGDLEALPVDDGGAGLIVLLLTDPHLLEGGQRGQDGATDPNGIFPLRRSNDLQ